MVKRGASGGSFNFIVAFGDNSAKPHSVPTKRKLKANDIVLVDCGCIYNGYCSDITRTWFWGKATKQLTAMYQAVLAGNKIGIKHAHGNIIGQALDKIVRDTVKQNWGENYDIPHGVGHGVGLAIHESPRVNKIYNLPLPINSVVTIEPGIYIPNIGGIRIEDLIVITKTGCKVLTKSCPK
jgi:Xaa-Pro aminopeptidase